MFASKTLTEHLARGAAGAALLAAALALGAEHRLLAFALVPGAFALFRGCPLCWTLGLVATIAGRRWPEDTACRGGACARPTPPSPGSRAK